MESKTIHLHGFPTLLPAEDIKTFVERHTGKGTIEALEVKLAKAGPVSYARIQFIDIKYVNQIMSMAASRMINYDTHCLRAWANETDMIRLQQLKTYDQRSLQNVSLSLGCQTSKDRFSILWGSENVCVKFGIGRLERMCILLSHESVEHKLQLSYESVWQVHLHRQRGRRFSPGYLVIQLLGAPRIYKKLESSVLCYYKETPDDQWLRTTDFTSSFCIGQSSCLCLEVPIYIQLPNLNEHFSYYKESESRFILEKGAPFSNNQELVPIVAPPEGFEIPYKILFKVCSLVQNGCLPGPSLDANFYSMIDPQKQEIDCIERALEKLYHSKECCYEPVKWLNEQYEKYNMVQKQHRPPLITLGSGLVCVYRVQVTPCKVYFCGPELNMSNRVLRNYPEDVENFLRVSFVDEDWEKMHSSDLSPRASSSTKEKTAIYDRILSTLRNGLVIGNKKFEFLAFSSSQLQENSLWMFASRPGLSADDIRTWMGDFHQIQNVAKYAARLGQSFGSSTGTMSVGKHEIEIIPDVEVIHHGVRYVFSDGIGKISAKFAREVALKCGLKNFTPSAFQIRYAGYKGVVAIDPTSSVKLSLRKSMSKYDSEYTTLDVLAWSKHQSCYLNRQLITLLSTLGVHDSIFEIKQTEAVNQLNSILTDPQKAQEALELICPGETGHLLKEMLLCGYKPDVEPFLSMMLQTLRASKLLDLRTRTRILIPKGRAMMGCLDETRTLEYGEVFVQVSNHRQKKYQEGSIIEGDIVVAKNPCLHPGDMRVLKAVNAPALHHMVDCVVFPQKGHRPHPNECSGSDLDGDIYFVCWDPNLIPPQQIPPMDYSPTKAMTQDHEVTTEEIQEYFADYIVNNNLGIIANAHTACADKEPLMARGDPCVQLAKQFSIAVDFPKTGVPAKIPYNLRVEEYPDFMEKPDKPIYESTRVIGKLFRDVKYIPQYLGSFGPFTREVARRAYDPDMEVGGFRHYIKEAFEYKTEYDFQLGNLMDYYGIKTEAEILTGGILKTSKAFDRRRDAEAIGLAMRSLRKDTRSWFSKGRNDLDTDHRLYAKASAWYYVTYRPHFYGRYNVGLYRDHFLSFPWTIYNKLIEIKMNKTRNRWVPQIIAIED